MLKSLIRFGLVVAATGLIHGQTAQAQSARFLPLGNAVAFQGAECGLIGDNWVPGTIQNNGKFLALAQQLKSVSAQLRRATTDSQRTRLNKLKKAINKRIKQHKPICNVFNNNVRKPAGSVAAEGDARTIIWSANVTDDSFVVGSTYKFFCPANGSSTSRWGTDIYTADSSICGAAVHAGLITVAKGGNVTLRVLGGQPRYFGSLRNEETTNTFNEYVKSFVFINPATGAEVISAAPLVIPWNYAMSVYRSSVGSSFSFICPANGSTGSLWGTDVYTDDSSVCTAAVHARKASRKKGGLVSVRIIAGQPSYVGTSRNGINSNNYGAWGGSFGFN